MTGAAPQPRRYFRRLSALLLGSLVLVMAVNVWVDGFGLFGFEGIAGINRDKRPGNVRLSKAYAVERGAYDGLIIGSSRSEIGLDPQNPQWAAYRAYNLSLPGPNIHEIYRYLQHAQAAHPLRRVLFGLDFVYFTGAARWPDTFEDRRLLVDEHNHPQRGYFLQDLLQANLSMSAIDKSLETIRANRAHKGPTHTPRGQVGHDQPFLYVMRDGGFQGSFRRVDHEYLTGWSQFPQGQAYFLPKPGGRSTLDTYEDILAFCHEHRIELVLVISPLHAQLQLGLDALGMYDNTYVLWKRELVQRNAAVAARYGQVAFALFDFATINAYTTDPVPPAGQDRRPDAMHWYWDPAHYRSELGDRVQAVALGGEADPGEPLFGVRLTPETMEASLQQERAALDGYREQSRALWESMRREYVRKPAQAL